MSMKKNATSYNVPSRGQNCRWQTSHARACDPTKAEKQQQQDETENSGETFAHEEIVSLDTLCETEK